MGKFNIEIQEVKGTCEEEIFKTMIQRGDIQADKVNERLDEIFNITGYAKTHITTDTKDFVMCYYATDDGYLSSGSEVFYDSVKAYFGQANAVKIKEIKTSKGKTYKAVPILKRLKIVDEDNFLEN